MGMIGKGSSRTDSNQENRGEAIGINQYIVGGIQSALEMRKAAGTDELSGWSWIRGRSIQATKGMRRLCRHARRIS